MLSVWQKLEEENREFFKAYHVRLLLKNQILVFNKLLEKQVELMQKVCPPGVASIPLSNGSSSSTCMAFSFFCHIFVYMMDYITFSISYLILLHEKKNILLSGWCVAIFICFAIKGHTRQ